MATNKKSNTTSMEGLNVTTQGIQEVVLEQLAINAKLNAAGKKKYSICLWGTHGIGKTDIIKSLAKHTIGGKPIRIESINPAQYEEMGDLTGMPIIEEGRTFFRKPEWVPDENNQDYGILFIDDFNRANERIIQGTMQLIQDYQLISWKLPANWTIVCSANPETSDYNVTDIDDAVKTRMFHYNMVFDAREWLKWATVAGIDDRILYFASQHSEELFNQEKGGCNPRAFGMFAESVTMIEDWKVKKENSSQEIVNPQIYGRLVATRCGNNITNLFSQFILNNSYLLPTIEQLLESKEDVKTILDKVAENSSMIMSTTRVILNRIVNYITLNYYSKDLGNSKGKTIVERIKQICLHSNVSTDNLMIFVEDVRRIMVKDASGKESKIPSEFMSGLTSGPIEIIDANGKKKSQSIMLKTYQKLI